MLIGYMRVGKADQYDTADLQRNALQAAGVSLAHIYEDRPSDDRDQRPALAACLEVLRQGDTFVVWRLERLARDLHHLVRTVHKLTIRGVGFKVLNGHGAALDTTTSSGILVFGLFAALIELERDLLAEKTKAGLSAARARGRLGGRPFKMTEEKLQVALASMGSPETIVADLCTRLGVTRQTLYRHVAPDGSLRPDGQKLLEGKKISK